MRKWAIYSFLYLLTTRQHHQNRMPLLSRDAASVLLSFLDAEDTERARKSEWLMASNAASLSTSAYVDMQADAVAATSPSGGCCGLTFLTRDLYPRLTSMRVGSNNLRVDSARARYRLGTFLNSRDFGTRLLSLDLSRNGLRDNGLAHLSHFVRLQELNLSRNSIRGSGLKHIETLTHLTSLDLSGNSIGSCGALESLVTCMPQLLTL